MKLKTKIQLFSSLMMIASIALVNTAIYIVFMNISQKIEMDHLTSQVNTVVQTMNANRDIPASDLFRSFLPENGMIRLINEAEEEVTVITRDQAYRELPIKFSETEQSMWVRNEDNDRFGVVRKPYIDNEGNIITVEMVNHFTELEKTARTLFYVLLFAALIMLIPAIVAATILSRFILRPIQQLIETMKENEKQMDWKKIPLDNRSEDELYVMGKTYNDLMDTLKQTYEKQEMFVSDASHELKTPIAIIKSYTQLMRRHGADPEITEEALEAITTESDRMQELVEQMLLLARHEEAQTYHSIYLPTICRDSMKQLQGLTDKQLKYEEIGHVRNNVYGHADQLKQVIYILLDNAIKYGGQIITIQIKEEPNKQIITIHDDGDGIPEEHLTHLFDRFYRVDKARTRKDGGTGLGLAIAKSIINNHHGDLTVVSSQGEGTTFMITLPIDMR